MRYDPFQEKAIAAIFHRVRRIRAAVGPLAFPGFAGDQEMAEAVLGGAPLAESAAPPLDAGIRCPALVREGRGRGIRYVLVS